MKLLFTLIVLAWSYAHASSLSVTSDNILIGENGNEVVSLIPMAGGMIEVSSSMDRVLDLEKIVSSVDHRPQDGSLTITLESGSTIVQTTGDTRDGIMHVYLNRNGAKIEMHIQPKVDVKP